jgi:hypothetical protein
MPAGTCDPASRGAAYNEGEFAVAGGAVVVPYRYGWDGPSTMETGCVGPLQMVSGTNNSTQTYYAHFQGRKGTWRRVQLDPGQSVTYDKTGQLKQAGLIDNTDLDGLYITTDPNPPSNARTT